MKMAMIAYNEAIDDEVMEMLAQCGLKNYTKVGRAFGRGDASGTHLGTDIWPGLNNVVFVALEDEKAAMLLDRVKRARNALGSEGVKAFVWSLDAMTQ